MLIGNTTAAPHTAALQKHAHLSFPALLRLLALLQYRFIDSAHGTKNDLQDNSSFVGRTLTGSI